MQAGGRGACSAGRRAFVTQADPRPYVWKSRPKVIRGSTLARAWTAAQAHPSPGHAHTPRRGELWGRCGGAPSVMGETVPFATTFVRTRFPVTSAHD